MLNGLLGCDALLRIKCHHFVHKVDSRLARIRYQLTQRGGHELGESEANLRGQLVTFGPLGLGGTTQDGTSFVYLVCLIVAWEERSHQVEFSHYCSQGEDVDGTVVVGAS